MQQHSITLRERIYLHNTMKLKKIKLYLQEPCKSPNNIYGKVYYHIYHRDFTWSHHSSKIKEKQG